MIQVITFDLWNTLLENIYYSKQRVQSFIQFLKKRDIVHSFNEIKRAYDIGFDFSAINLETLRYRHIYTEDRVLKMLQILNIEFPQVEKDLIQYKFEEAILSNPPPLKLGVKKTLEELSIDYKIGLISNTGVTPGRILRNVLEDYSILQYFDITIFSDETGLFKPHQKMFKVVLKKFDCAPNNAIHIGDMLETDIKGAQDCNMLSIWIRNSNTSELNDIKPDYEIEEISEVLPLIKKLS